jgi:hypothetical protein
MYVFKYIGFTRGYLNKNLVIILRILRYFRNSKTLLFTGVNYIILTLLMKLKIAVIDGQGGGIGEQIVRKLRKSLSEAERSPAESGINSVPMNIGDTEIIALGTNSIATSTMMKAGANRGATGENAIVINTPKVGCIMGTIGIITANAMMGELTPKMAEAIASSPAKKILLPLNMENIEVVGINHDPLPHLIDKLINNLQKNT